MPTLIQPSFAKGELAPSLYGRTDTAAYQVGLRTARNTIIHPYGGVSNRSGLKFLAPIKTHAAVVRLIPFEFKTEDQYVLEFGNLYMRVMRNDAHVLDASEQETITGATQANPVVITTATHDYATGQEVFISGVSGMTELNNNRYTITVLTTTTFSLQDQVTGTDVDGTGFTTFTSGGTADIIFEIVTPYLTAELFDITFVQSADVITLCHKNHNIKELTRTDHDAWTLTTLELAPSLDDPTSVGITVNTTGTETDQYQITAIDEDGEESLPGIADSSVSISGATQANPVVITVTSHSFIAGDEMEINGITGMTELNKRRFNIANPTSTTFELEGEDGTSHTAYSSGGTSVATFKKTVVSASTKDNTITWDAVTNASKYGVYRRSGGIYGIIGETTNLTFDDNNISPDTTESPPLGRDPFELNNNPGAVTYYEQRRVFGGSTSDPDTNWFSQTGRISNFNIRSPVQADDAIEAKLTSRQVNEIRQYVPGNDLIVFSSGAEWKLNSGNDNFFGPSTIQQKPQTSWGSSFRPPIEIGQTVMFVAADEKSIRSFGFSLQLDGYTGTNILLFANHLLEDDTVKDWSFTRIPDTRIHVVLASGKALTFTFDQEQEVIAWTRWDTDGSFESTASLTGGGASNEDSVYYVVQRTINGNTVRYIEVWRQRFFDTVEDCFYVDSGLSLDNPVTITATTAANPVVVTSASHGLSNLDIIDIEDITWIADFDADFNETQPDQLNGTRFVVANVTTNTFELTSHPDGDNIDGSSFNAYVSGGVFRLAVTTLSGLDHLEGESVVALMDGNVVSSLTVASGSVTLPRASTRIHIGLRFIADIETLDIESPQGTTQGQKKKVNSVTVRFRKSRGLLIGPTSDDLQEMKQREFEKMGEPTQLLTGDKKIDIKPAWNSNGRLFLRQIYPLPLMILAVIPHLIAEDDE